jgi:hypothetical protein
MTVCQTCKHMESIIRDSSYLQFIIELAVYGLCLRKDSDAGFRYRSAVEKLDEFRKSRIAWERLEPPSNAHIDTEPSEYELSEGTLGNAVSDYAERSHGIEFFRLWMDDQKGQCPVWRRYENVGFILRDFSFNREEDLLVLSQAPLINTFTNQYV